jgi:hypothetical protein
VTHAELVAIALRLWAAMGAPHPTDGPAIADAIATVIEGDRCPAVFATHLEDLAVMAKYAKDESDVRAHPGHWVDPRTGKAVDPIAQGPWQTHRLGPDATPLEYARDWLAQLHDGARVCPASPLAPLSGSCLLARPLADRRAKKARELLAQVMAPAD